MSSSQHWSWMEIFSSQGFCNKVPQSGWCKTMEMYSLVVLEARSPKSKCWQSHTPSIQLLGRVLFLPVPAYVALGIPWLVAVYPISTFVFLLCVYACVPKCLSLRIPVTLDQWPTLLKYYIILTLLITSASTLFQIKSHSEVLGVKTSTYTMGEHNSTQESRERTLRIRPDLEWPA